MKSYKVQTPLGIQLDVWMAEEQLQVCPVQSCENQRAISAAINRFSKEGPPPYVVQKVMEADQRWMETEGFVEAFRNDPDYQFETVESITRGVKDLDEVLPWGEPTKPSQGLLDRIRKARKGGDDQ